jgi:hypothetical protein
MTDKPSQWPLTVDYRAAVAEAVEWLGARYLLAEPMRALPASGRTRLGYPVDQAFAAEGGSKE